ncbi:acetyl esterase/lipase [Neisseria sp. HSC-16F19]|nr:alpha/beta hydrolase [Neisseria sp. HSC-16F19]MCP2039673.1 acetyl esterase/lipase [Neisseria sp. HSC-16F19]
MSPLPELFRLWRKYSVGIGTHVLFNPYTPLSWQRLASNSVGQWPLLQVQGINEDWLIAAGRPVCRFSTAESRSDAAMVFFHGGGFTAGSIHSHRPMCGHLARATGLPVYSVDYRLAPEHPYPAAPDDCERAALALMEHTGLPAARWVVAGDSAGGNLALVTALRLKRQDRQAAALMLLSPWCDPASTDLPWRFDPVINPFWGMASARAYRGNTPAQEPGLAPLYDDLRGLPPVLLQAGREEILFPQIEALADALRLADVNTTFQVYERLWHSGQMMAAFSRSAAEAVRQCGVFVEHHLPQQAA